MAASIGDKLNLIGFFFAVVGGLAALLGTALMFLGSSLEGESIWQNLKKNQKIAEQASVVIDDHWTEKVPQDFSDAVPANAKIVQFCYQMRSPDTRTPLKMTVSTSIDVISARVSGAQGVFELRLIDRVVYVSVAHPTIDWTLVTTAYKLG